MAAEKGACRKRKWSKTGSLFLLMWPQNEGYPTDMRTTFKSND